MQGFVTKGIENPEKQVTKKGFREYFVKGIVEDDLPYSLGQKSERKSFRLTCFRVALQSLPRQFVGISINFTTAPVKS